MTQVEQLTLDFGQEFELPPKIENKKLMQRTIVHAHTPEMKNNVFTSVLLLNFEENVGKIGMSFCNSKEQFERKLGVAYAEGRARHKPLIKVSLDTILEFGGTIKFLTKLRNFLLRNKSTLFKLKKVDRETTLNLTTLKRNDTTWFIFN